MTLTRRRLTLSGGDTVILMSEERDEAEARMAERADEEEEADAFAEEDEEEGFDLDAPWPESPLHFFLPGVSAVRYLAQLGR